LLDTYYNIVTMHGPMNVKFSKYAPVCSWYYETLYHGCCLFSSLAFGERVLQYATTSILPLAVCESVQSPPVVLKISMTMKVLDV